MIAISDLLSPAYARVPAARASNELIVLHLANPKRRSLIRTIGYAETPEGYLRSLYGPSWGDVQADLRELIKADIIVASGVGKQTSYSLELSQFPVGVLDGILGGNQQSIAA